MPWVRGNLTSWCLLSGSNGLNIANSSSILSSAEVSLTLYDYEKLKNTLGVIADFLGIITDFLSIIVGFLGHFECVISCS